MPITVNEGGVLNELETITVNEGGTLYNLDTVTSNEGGTLYEIYSAKHELTQFYRVQSGYYHPSGSPSGTSAHLGDGVTSFTTLPISASLTLSGDSGGGTISIRAMFDNKTSKYKHLKFSWSSATGAGHMFYILSSSIEGSHNTFEPTINVVNHGKFVTFASTSTTNQPSYVTKTAWKNSDNTYSGECTMDLTDSSISGWMIEGCSLYVYDDVSYSDTSTITLNDVIFY